MAGGVSYRGGGLFPSCGLAPRPPALSSLGTGLPAAVSLLWLLLPIASCWCWVSWCGAGTWHLLSFWVKFGHCPAPSAFAIVLPQNDHRYIRRARTGKSMRFRKVIFACLKSLRSLYNAAQEYFLLLWLVRSPKVWVCMIGLLCFTAFVKFPWRLVWFPPHLLLQIYFNSLVQNSLCANPFVCLSCRVVWCSQCAYHHGIWALFNTFHLKFAACFKLNKASRRGRTKEEIAVWKSS